MTLTVFRTSGSSKGLLQPSFSPSASLGSGGLEALLLGPPHSLLPPRAPHHAADDNGHSDAGEEEEAAQAYDGGKSQ